MWNSHRPGPLSREAPLVLLAERANAFSERHEGVAVSTGLVDEFLAELRHDTKALKEASEASDAAFFSRPATRSPRRWRRPWSSDLAAWI
jgi:hypothetical protein